jgi:hypothetical protein
MSGAVAPSGSVTVELLAQHIAVFVSEERTKGMFASIAGLARDFECLTEEALIIVALWHRPVLLQCRLIIVPNNPPTQGRQIQSALMLGAIPDAGTMLADKGYDGVVTQARACGPFGGSIVQLDEANQLRRISFPT